MENLHFNCMRTFFLTNILSPQDQSDLELQLLIHSDLLLKTHLFKSSHTPSLSHQRTFVLQNFLRVALQELDSGCTGKTLMVHPYTTTEEVCSLCAYKFKIPDPESYALFLVTEDTSQQLALDTHPQRIKAELHSRPLAHAFHFVYRKIPNLNLCVPVQNGNCLV